VVLDELGQPADDILSIFELPEKQDPGIRANSTPFELAVAWRPARRRLSSFSMVFVGNAG
jgi:hypothetical protein